MKRLLVLFVALFATFAAIADERPITKQELPKGAIKFLAHYFEKDMVTYATIDKDLMTTEYKVVLKSGAEVEFDSKGRWESIESPRGGSVPQELIPSYVTAELAKVFSNVKLRVIKLSKDGKNLEVELSNGVELKFNSKGKVIEIED